MSSTSTIRGSLIRWRTPSTCRTPEPGRLQVAPPVDVGTVGQRDREPAVHRLRHDRRGVAATGPPADVLEPCRVPVPVPGPVQHERVQHPLVGPPDGVSNAGRRLRNSTMPVIRRATRAAAQATGDGVATRGGTGGVGHRVLLVRTPGPGPRPGLSGEAPPSRCPGTGPCGRARPGRTARERPKNHTGGAFRPWPRHHGAPEPRRQGRRAR